MITKNEKKNHWLLFMNTVLEFAVSTIFRTVTLDIAISSESAFSMNNPSSYKLGNGPIRGVMPLLCPIWFASCFGGSCVLNLANTMNLLSHSSEKWATTLIFIWMVRETLKANSNSMMDCLAKEALRQGTIQILKMRQKIVPFCF